MIAVDTSALKSDDRLVISAGTLTEALIVAQARDCAADLVKLIDGLGIEVVPVDAATTRRAAAAHARWGRGTRSAGLNFGDCFAYDVAKEHGCPLLYVGLGFAKTDVAGVV